MEYPTANDLDRMGATLQRDVCLWTPRLAREYASDRAPQHARVVRSEPDPPSEADAPPARKHRRAA